MSDGEKSEAGAGSNKTSGQVRDDLGGRGGNGAIGEEEDGSDGVRGDALGG